MFLTKESDYGVRIIRALSHGKKMSVKDICDEEHVPQQYSYKILKKLEKSGMVESFRGAYGGYGLRKSLNDITLYDIITAIESNLNIIDCMDVDVNCINNSGEKICKVHQELCCIQSSLIKQLKEKSMSEILFDSKEQ